jgi:hypothetical protein
MSIDWLSLRGKSDASAAALALAVAAAGCATLNVVFA